jgi:uncharacterized protein YjbI with pentapeptide repeats
MSDTNGLEFSGKYAISTPDGKKLITVSGNKLQLNAGDPNNPGAAQQFNTYGDLLTGFTLQAPNDSWQYVEFNNAYIADKSRGDAACSLFSVHSVCAEEWVTIVETAASMQFYVVTGNDGLLSRAAKGDGDPPDAARFIVQSQPPICYGLKTMRNQGSTLSNPLTGVYLAGQDLRGIDFSGSDVSYADFSATTLDKSSPFDGCTAKQTTFDQAVLVRWVANGLTFSECSFAAANFTNASLFMSVLKGCIINQANFMSAILQQTDFTQAVMVGCKFQDAVVNDAIFNGATLTNSDFSLAKVPPLGVDFRDTILIGVNLSVIENRNGPNPKVIGTDFTKCKISTNTNFMNAKIDESNFTGLDLSNMIFTRASMQHAKLDMATLDGAQMPFANLSFATITGGVSMIGANLSNAILQAAQLPGAQLGAIKKLISLPLSDSSLLDQKTVPPDMISALKLSSAAIVSSVAQAGKLWTVKDGMAEYQVSNNEVSLLVQQIFAESNAAVLTGAYMPNANFEQANLYAVEMGGVHWYGANANAQGADMSLTNLSGANLRGMVIEQASMQGAQFDYANLIGTQFNGADLSPSKTNKPTSFAFSSLQSTVFTSLRGSGLAYANLTNAAFCVTDTKGDSLGVPLFTLPAELTPSSSSSVIPTALRAAFGDCGYPLVTVATIKTQTPFAWMIGNVDKNDATQVGYGNFLMLLVKQPNEINYIQVYGVPPLMVQEVDDKGQLQQVTLAFGFTAASQQQMNGDTTCPSGMKLKYLSKYLTFEALMTAVQPPKPPICANCWG